MSTDRLLTPQFVRRADQLGVGDFVILDDVITGAPRIEQVTSVQIFGDDVVFSTTGSAEVTTSVGNTIITLGGAVVMR